MIYPVITLYQPWATWIIRGWKTIETRTHSRFACLEGKEIFIHAGNKTDVEAINNPYLTIEQVLFNPDEMINGFIIGGAYVKKFKSLSGRHSRAALIDCKNVQRYGLFLHNIWKCSEPIPVKGSMGIWYFDSLTKQKVKR